MHSQSLLVSHDLASAIADLSQGANWLAGASLSRLRELADECSLGVVRVAKDWVRAACEAKHIGFDQPVAAEEILAGPTAVLRYLRVLSLVLQAVERTGLPTLPGRPRSNSQGRLCVPVLPVDSMFDRLTFFGLKAEAWRQAGTSDTDLFTSSWQTSITSVGKIAGVLGAGNVSSIPASDTLYKIFHDREAVLLKLNPVNDYLEPFFNDAFLPLINAKLLRIVSGGPDIGESIVNNASITSLHLTGSHLTHAAIVWGRDPQDRATRLRENRPLVSKPVTSELGNVSPWIIVPGKYTHRQLRSQAEHVVASITNNASFNCLATKMIVTSRAWPQRAEFLELIESLFNRIPPRFAYYPGAPERFARATGRTSPVAPDGSLPWTLLRDANRNDSPQLFDEESFVCVCAETQLDASEPKAFLESAVDFANEQLFGTLCASLTFPSDFQRRNMNSIDGALVKLRYGTVSINQWSGVSYGLMTPPWGGYPGATIDEPISGIGHVHNVFCISEIDKAVLWGPLSNFPKPAWYPTNRSANQIAWSLLELYEVPKLTRLPKLFLHALRG